MLQKGLPRPDKNREQDHVHKRTRDDAPEFRARSVWRTHEGDSAEGPEQDPVGDASDLATGKGVSEFVQQHDQEKREVFVEREDRRSVAVRLRGQLVERDEKPAEVQEHVDARKTEKMNRAAAHRFRKYRPRVGHAPPALRSGRGGRVLQRHFRLPVVGREQKAHRHHGGFVEAVALEEILRAQFRTIGQESDAQEILLLREIDRVFEQHRAVAFPRNPL